MTKNVAASVKARLKNIAKEKDLNFDFVILRFMQERFLYRLSKSDYKDNFTLKGGLVLTLLGVSEFRPTKDIDFLGEKIENDQKAIKNIIKDICGTKVEDDGLKFLHTSITTEIIKEGADYEGVRIKLDVNLDSVLKKIALDVGFGDALSQDVIVLPYPGMLDYDEANIKIYPFESVISEKLESIVKLNYSTSRMKDFFDIHFLAENHKFTRSELLKSLETTFSKRKTSLDGLNVVYSDEFINGKNFETQWKAFLKRNELNVNKSFSEIASQIIKFIKPLFESKEAGENWNPKKWVWE